MEGHLKALFQARPGRSITRSCWRRQRGFTLLELIVAAGILALIAVFSWRGLDTMIREREAIAASQAAIDVYQRTFARLERDAVLAGDVQLDEEGTMRLVAGRASVDGDEAATVEYRLVGGTLTRKVVGTNAAPLVLLTDVSAMSIEAWQPAPGGGSWVRSKVASTEPPQLAANLPQASPGRGANGTANSGADAAAPPVRTGQAVNSLQGARTSPLVVASATGLRLSFARADGARVSRSFIVGGS